MKKSLLAGLDLPDLNKPVVTKPERGYPVTKPDRGYPVTQPEPIRPEVTRPPEPIRPEPMRPPDTACQVVQPDADPLNRKKAGRPRLHADHVLTPTEKARRYRRKRKSVTKGALDGSLLSVELALMSHRDLCLAVAGVLNRPKDMELRMNSTPAIKELKRRLTHWLDMV